MRIIGDYHTHTTYSHGKGAVVDNAIAAYSKGLAEIAITDHGFSHYMYGLSRKDAVKAREEIDKLNSTKYVKTYFGIEANINGLDGTLDLRRGEENKFDILLAGFHKAVWANKVSDVFKLFGATALSGIFGPTKSMLARNTKAVIKVIEKYPVDILTHLNLGMKVDIKEIAKAAADYGTLIELNGKRNTLNEADIEAVLASKADFIVNSDAHEPDRVGNFERPLTLIEKYSIPTERIANADKLPIFKRITR